MVLVMDLVVSSADGKAERREALASDVGRLKVSRPLPLGADKGYDTKSFVADCHKLGVTPHVAQNIQTRHRSAIDSGTTRHKATKPVKSAAVGSNKSLAG